MSKIEQIRESLKRYAENGGPAPTMLAKVVAVNEDAKTCSLDDDGLIYEDVRLSPIIEDEVNTKGLCIYPKINTWCLAVRIENENEWLAIAFEEVFKYRLKIGTTVFEITEDGVKISKGDDTLKSCLNDLITQVKAITVTCAASGSPSTIPLNGTAFTSIKTRIDNILK